MFDIGFGEFLLVLLVALLVLKPEQIPALTRVFAKRFVNAKQSLQRLKAEIQAELQDVDLKDDRRK